MVKNEFTFLSADGKTRIHAVEWLPATPPRAVLQIAHGVSEYILRYEPFARYLTEQGIAVVGNDHLGHGGSVAPGAPRVYFGPKGSWNWVVSDLYTLWEQINRRFPGIPCFLMGHSMGSFLARTYLIHYPGTVDGAILMGTGQMSPALIAGGQAVAAAEGRRIGESNPSPLVSKLSFEGYNKIFAPNRTPYDWLSVNTENVDAYMADPLCGENPSIGLFREMLGGMSFIAKQKNVQKMNLNTPILFISGAMDPVGDCGKGVERAYNSFLKAGMRDVSIKLYPELRHEILQEACWETVSKDIWNWLQSKLPTP